MSQHKDGARRADYWLDAPEALCTSTILGVAGILLGAVSHLALRRALPQLTTVLLNLGMWGHAYLRTDRCYRARPHRGAMRDRTSPPDTRIMSPPSTPPNKACLGSAPGGIY